MWASPHRSPVPGFLNLLSGSSVLPTCELVPSHWHFEGSSLQSLTLPPVGFCFQHLVLPSLLLSLLGFLPWSARAPLPRSRFAFVRCDLASPWPLVLDCSRTGFRFEIQFSLGALLPVVPRLARRSVSPLRRLGTLS